MDSWRVAVLAAGLAMLGCGPQPARVHQVQAPSGRVVAVIACHLAWGPQDAPGRDAFTLEFVSADLNADLPRREAEAREAFELIRPVVEGWRMDTASVAGFSSPERTGDYDLWQFQRDADGRWGCRRFSARDHAQ